MSSDSFGDLSWRRVVGGAAVLGLAVLAVAGVVAPESDAGRLLDILTAQTTLAATLRLSVPIAFAALGGIFAEKSGVINIGLEGLLIIAAFTGVYLTDVTGSVWMGVLGGVVASTVLAALFAVVCIEFRADQVIAGLAVWLIALGLAPFASQVVYGGPNTTSVETVGTLTIPLLSRIPFFGALFDATPFVYLMFVAVALSWYTINRTTFGRWVRASGENPKALDTAGVDVQRVRYAAVLLSGVLAGVGGAALSLSLGQFTGNGATMVNGKGFIAIVAYLFGNYNPVGALLSTMLFAGLDALQLTLQARDVFAVPKPLVRTIPYVTVIVVLALFGRTRTPEAAGDHYESGDD
ncbi:ribose ABC transporter permease [Halogeometricum pallidum JCM 14848]|uniref:Ribose ABC transporter permease n=1 Tax=Halogeometricum pallidum JCM 14848 TaxID=1227487 RepID=M0CS35_HALPD|nr:ABC transporter permease [Halogeometricum pallidum]ELZ26065.1 ribose ABC transporter permease [Halogeometricum pallidum JCM 14848]